MPSSTAPLLRTDSAPVPSSFVPVVPARTVDHVLHRGAHQPAATVIARHTAVKVKPGLGRAYTVQSLVTMLPLAIVDLVVTASALVFSAFMISSLQAYAFDVGTWRQLPAVLVFHFALMSLHQLYPGAGISPVDELRGIFRSTMIAMLCLAAANVMFGDLGRNEVMTFAFAAALIATLLPLARFVVRGMLSQTDWWGIRMLLIGTASDCEHIQKRSRTYRSSGYIVSDNFLLPDGTEQKFELHETATGSFHLADMYRAPVAALVSPGLQSLSSRLLFQFPSVLLVDHEASAQVNAEASEILGTFSSRSSMPLLRLTPRLIKRSLDLMICIPTLIVLAMPMALIAIAIKVYSPGPLIFGSERVGQHGKLFKMWKFRSMVPNASQVLKARLANDPSARLEWEQDQKLKSDPRIIPRIGNVMRRYSLDELPQLWNVLCGEMSIVGPRPVPPGEIVRYQNHYYEYTQMWPGMTGLWQVSGRNDTSFTTRVFLVRHYATNWSLWLDLWILVKTPIVVLAKRGAY